MAYVEDALDFMEKHHFRTDEVDWEAVREDMLGKVEADPTATGAYRAIETTLYPSREHPALYAIHTWFWRPDAAAERWSPPSVLASDPPTGERLDGDIGYLNLPSVIRRYDQHETYASQLRALIEKIDSDQPVCGWIIDLRDHEGGDAIVGWAGLGSLVGAEVYIRFVGNHETVTGSYQDGQVLQDGEPVTDPLGRAASNTVVDGYEPHDPTVPVAVLTSVLTASAGEAILVSFLGRPDTKSFGEPTAGVPTAGKRLDMPDGAQLEITAYRYQDRHGRTYDASIRPDEVVLAIPGGSSDATVTAATEWLLDTGECGR